MEPDEDEIVKQIVSLIIISSMVLMLAIAAH